MEKEEVSTKAFFLSALDYFRYLGRYWALLLSLLIIGNLYDVIKTKIVPDNKLYGGMVEFNVDLEGGNANQLGGLASTFMGMNTANNSGILDATNFPEIMLSQAVFENVYMTELELFGRKDLFINFLIDSSDIKQKEWGGSLLRAPSHFREIKFTKKKIEELTPYENQALFDVTTKLQAATHLEKEQGTSLYKLSAKLTNELLTKTWLETLVLKTEAFYTKMKTSKTEKLIEFQKSRVDSLGVLLRRNDGRLASTTFEQPDAVTPISGLNQVRLSRDNTYLSNLYLTSLANLDNLNNMLIQQTPMFHILNPVKLPLIPTNRSGISLRLNGLILVVAAIFFLTIRRSFVEIMSEKE